MLRLEQHKLYSTGKEWRILNVSSQSNFSTQFWRRCQIYRTVKVKGRELKRVGGIFMNYLRTGGVVWTQNCCSSPFQSFYGLFLLLSWQLSTVMVLVGVSFGC